MGCKGHIKVALTSNSLTTVDADFVSAKQILFYDVSGDGVQFLDAMQFDGVRPEGQRGPGGGTGCSNLEPMDGASAVVMDAKISSLRGCGLLVTLRLSDFAAVRIHNGRTFPVKMEQQRDVTYVLKQLQHLLNTNPPLWLRKKLMLPAAVVAPAEEAVA
jgi:nitrogen fixation protein NifX